MFEEIIGHNREKTILERELNNNSFSHAYLFTGPEGIGKKSLAALFAIELIKNGLEDQTRKVDLNHSDIFTLGFDGKNIAIRDIRNLKNETLTKPLEGEYRVFLIDNADTMNQYAQNALLKTLEEPNPGNIFILISSNPNLLLPTIQSRCQDISFRDLSPDDKRTFVKKSHLSLDSVDLTQTPGQIISLKDNPEKTQRFKNFYLDFEKIRNGDTFTVFKLAEELAKDREESKEVITYFIRNLHKNLLDKNKPNKETIRIINILIELLEKMAYNINLRLQWENCLLQIIMEH